ncbi:MAG: hypothetical protein JWM68_2465 [Verrucomicrobiales bacterium]|nr:hypothetical protein [Verrucomicrobiales bacterium]
MELSGKLVFLAKTSRRDRENQFSRPERNVSAQDSGLDRENVTVWPSIFSQRDGTNYDSFQRSVATLSYAENAAAAKNWREEI